MKNVCSILDARLEKIQKKFSYKVGRNWETTIGACSADRDDPKVSNVLESLTDTVRSRSEMYEKLFQRAFQMIPLKETMAIRKKLLVSPLLMFDALAEKVKNAGDLEDPLVLAMFNAAVNFLVHYRNLEKEWLAESLNALGKHIELTLDRPSARSRGRSRPKQNVSKKTGRPAPKGERRT